MKEEKRERAKELVKQKKSIEAYLIQREKILNNLEKILETVENTEMDLKIAEAISEGSKVLKHQNEKV